MGTRSTPTRPCSNSTASVRSRRDHAPGLRELSLLPPAAYSAAAGTFLPQAGGQPMMILSVRLRRERRRRRSREAERLSPTALNLPAREDVSLLPPPSFVGRRDQPWRKREDSFVTPGGLVRIG